MEAAKKGILTKEMKSIAESESMDEKVLMERVAKGEIAIPANKKHSSLLAKGVGTGLSTKINVNLGISKDCPDVDKELEKVKVAIDMKADAIMDLSSFGKTEEFRKKLITMSTAMVGTVPVYDAIGFYDKELKDIKAEEFLDVVRKHAEDGVDFVTIHAGLNREAVNLFKRNERITNIVSRGGSLRSGCLNDATDACQIKELITLGELTKRAWKRNVQIIIEGPGHMAIDEIEANVKLEKKLCHNAPFYVLGPLVTDVAPGYDHITSAIGGAIAAAAGVDFLCYVTPAEHLRLPNLDDMKEGIIASRIAAHAADISKKVPNAIDWDNRMAKYRADIDWEGMFTEAIDEEKARRYRKESTPENEDTCTMCGKMCSMRTMKKVMSGEDVNILK